MDTDTVVISLHLLGALAAGGAIGLERSFHARPAGFRTHTLVCLASSLLMLVTLYQWKWLPGVPLDTVRTDPARMAQGIMTGIGFLGAGVIFIRFARDDAMPEGEVRAMLHAHGFTVANMSYRVTGDGRWFEYRMVIRTTVPGGTGRLADALRRLVAVPSFRFSPTGD